MLGPYILIICLGGDEKRSKGECGGRGGGGVADLVVGGA